MPAGSERRRRRRRLRRQHSEAQRGVDTVHGPRKEWRGVKRTEACARRAAQEHHRAALGVCARLLVQLVQLVQLALQVVLGAARLAHTRRRQRASNIAFKAFDRARRAVKQGTSRREASY
eukprot:6197566-Pleurochrysis_carterae.AAC.7